MQKKLRIDYQFLPQRHRGRGVFNSMDMLKIRLCEWLIPRILSKKCPDDEWIPTSGPEGEKVNCYSIAFDDQSNPFFLVRNYQDGKLEGCKWDGDSYGNKKTYTIAELAIDKQLKLTHYYGLTKIIFYSIYKAVFHYLTRWIYVKTWVKRRIGSVNKFFFHKKKFFTKQRIELLKFMMDDQLSRYQHGRSPGGILMPQLMSKLYSYNWISHPSADEQERKLELYLGSLVESGDVEYNDGEYIVKGKAISTLERYEEEERRHIEAVKLQKKMFWLTLVLAIAAIIQSGIIKLPTLFDWSLAMRLNIYASLW